MLTALSLSAFQVLDAILPLPIKGLSVCLTLYLRCSFLLYSLSPSWRFECRPLSSCLLDAQELSEQITQWIKHKMNLALQSFHSSEVSPELLDWVTSENIDPGSTRRLLFALVTFVFYVRAYDLLTGCFSHYTVRRDGGGPFCPSLSSSEHSA